jgi:exopolysaccharide biosynthesis polyprenyl glycosylphosphotransferase
MSATGAPSAEALDRTEQASRRFGADILRRRMLAAADTLALTVAAVAVALGGATDTPLLVIAFSPFWIVLAKLLGLYDRDHRRLRCLTVDELPMLLFWAFCGTAVMTTTLLELHALVLSDAARIEIWVAIVVAGFLFRSAARVLWRRLTPREQVVVVGTGPLASAIERKLELFSDIHADLTARIPDSEQLVEQLDSLSGVGRILLACDKLTEATVASLLPVCRRRGIKLTVVPPARGMFGTAVTLGHVADLPVLEYNTWDVSRSTLLLKRTCDVVVSALALLVLSPVLLLVAVLIAVDDGFPVFFRQDRAGLHAEPFRMVKFRTMVRDAERRLADIVAFDELEDPMFKLQNDPRVTRVGRLLRRTSLDELPQLWNVLRGDMSLVGPRPEQIELVELYRSEDRFRLSVKPGLTGPMQVYGRGELTFDERLAVEREYIENLTVLRDLRLLLMTVPAVFAGRGAF